MKPGPIEAITLDVDGTLYSIRGMILRHPFSMLPLLGFFRDLHKVRNQLREQGPFEDFQAEQARRLSIIRKITPQQAARMTTKIVYDQWIQKFRRVSPFPGLKTALQDLIQHKVALGIISDYPIQPKLEGMGIADLPFKAMVVSEELGALKPHPLPFLKAAQALGVPVDKVLHVGDREDSDVKGALAAGMRAALFFQGKENVATQAEFCFSHWSQFVPILTRRKMVLKIGD